MVQPAAHTLGSDHPPEATLLRRRPPPDRRGVRTLKEELEKVASHNERHLGQIRLALRDRSDA